MAVGRISGPLLKANLLRDGVDLAFENDLLYLDVINGRVGIKTASPTHDLTINGTTRTTNVEVTNQLEVATFTITGDTITSSSNTINLVPTGTNPVVYQGKIVVDQLQISTNTIATTGTNTNLEITTTGTGTVNFNSDVNVYGDVHATGTITADGNINLGNANTDNIVFGGEVNSNIVPDADNTYNLGSNLKRWYNLYSNNVNVTTLNTDYLYVDTYRTAGIDITGNVISSIASNSDINFVTSGTGGVRIGNLKFYNNTVTNVASNAVTVFEETGTGYVKLTGQKGVVIPSGTVSQRPEIQYQETGMMRFNTELQLVEIFNGSVWTSVAGTSGGVTFNDATEIGVAMVLTLG
jgi:hypothetical protein